MNSTRILALAVIGLISGVAAYALLTPPTTTSATANGRFSNQSSWQGRVAPSQRSRSQNPWQESNERWQRHKDPRGAWN